MPVSERKRSGGAALATVLGVALLAVAGTARADYREDYAQGLKAASDGKWAEVERRMRDALQSETTPTVQTRLYGQRFEPYVPQFFLGIAAYQRGDCNAAVQYLQNAATRRVIVDSRAKRRLGSYLPVAEKGLAECELRLAGARTAPPPVAPSATPPVVTTPSPPVVAANPPPPRPVTSAPAPTPPAPRPVATPPPVTVASKPQPATPQPATPRPAAPPPAAPASTAVPAQLTTALDNYLRGRYQQVASTDPAQLTDARARYHALLLRAAARHTLGLMQGAGGRTLLDQAAADVRAAKMLQPAAPDSLLFSPRFRQFYGATP